MKKPKSMYLTLLLIKLWRAITLLIREERYMTNIISFVFTANIRNTNNHSILKIKLIRNHISIIIIIIMIINHIYNTCIPAKAFISSDTLRFGSRLKTSCKGSKDYD